MPAGKYWKTIVAAIDALWRAGDTLQCTEIWRSAEPTRCELCGHFPIRILHRLKNLRTGRSLIVGTECVVNYKRVVEEKMSQTFDLLVVPDLRWWADKMNAKEPGIVRILADSRNGTFDDLAVLEAAYAMNARMDGELATSDLADLEDAYDEDDEDLTEDDNHDPDEEAPEGLGRDEVDWDSLWSLNGRVTAKATPSRLVKTKALSTVMHAPPPA